MSSPYRSQPRKAFWKPSVGQKTSTSLEDLYKKKFEITEEMRIVTAGSCFAQHIARRMKYFGFNVVDAEPPPPGIPKKLANDFGYGIYSARYGNIYYARQLLQLAKEALGQWKPSDWVWKKGDEFYDAMRPSQEPRGLNSADEVFYLRKKHLEHVRDHVLKACDVFIFTFGLTEAWVHRPSGTVYPTAPDTIAGEFSAELHQFVNFSFNDVYRDFVEFKELLENINPNVKFLVTVSPVPLAATATSGHVLPATIYSKSVLRAVAGQLAGEFSNVDYFPSYEIITNVLAGSSFFDQSSGYRNVTDDGVETAMRHFFSEHAAYKKAPADRKLSEEDVMCEEVLLEAIGT